MYTPTVPRQTIIDWFEKHFSEPNFFGVDGIYDYIIRNNFTYSTLNTKEYGHAISDEDSIDLFQKFVSVDTDEEIIVIVDWCFKQGLFYKMNLRDFCDFIINNERWVVFNSDCIVLFNSGKVFLYHHEDIILYSELKFL